jgi:hypothetical protein
MDMRNEVLPPFSNMQTQRELHDWLKRRLNVLGFSNTSEISQPVFDFLHLRTDQNTSDLPLSDLVGNDSAQYVKQGRMQNDKEQRQILLDNLINLSGQVYLLFIRMIHRYIRQHIDTCTQAYASTNTHTFIRMILLSYNVWIMYG